MHEKVKSSCNSASEKPAQSNSTLVHHEGLGVLLGKHSLPPRRLAFQEGPSRCPGRLYSLQEPGKVCCHAPLLWRDWLGCARRLNRKWPQGSTRHVPGTELSSGWPWWHLVPEVPTSFQGQKKARSQIGVRPGLHIAPRFNRNCSPPRPCLPDLPPGALPLPEAGAKLDFALVFEPEWKDLKRTKPDPPSSRPVRQDLPFEDPVEEPEVPETAAIQFQGSVYQIRSPLMKPRRIVTSHPCDSQVVSGPRWRGCGPGQAALLPAT